MAAILGGCAQPGPMAPEPPMRDAGRWWAAPSAQPVPAALDASDAEAAERLPDAPALSAAALPSPSWWRAWGDAELDALVQRALQGDPDLQAAEARLAAAAAQTRAALAAGGAQLGLAGDVTLQRFSAVGLIPPAVAGSTRTTAQVMASGSWSPDWSGRLQAEWQAALGQARAQALSVVAARHALAAGVARQYVALAHVISQRAALDREATARRRYLALVAERVKAGIDPESAAEQAAQPLAQLAVLDEALAGQAVRLRQQLAVLSGQAPGALADLSPPLDRLQPGPVPPHLGADLLGRRAEVQAARWQVESSRHALRAARAQYHPDINLNAAVGLSALGLDKLFQLGARQASVGPAFHLPLFDGGRLDALQQVRNAERDAAIARYNAAVRDAVRDAADALAGVQATQRQIDAQRAVLRSLDDVRRRADERHRAGVGDRLAVVAAEAERLAQDRQRLGLEAAALTARVDLARALGGGWTDTLD